MDTTHLSILLDRLREGQIQQAMALHDLAQNLREALRLQRDIINLLRDRPSSMRSKATAVLSTLTSGTFAQYATAAMLLVYVLKGGDILTAVSTIAKAFGGQ
jgi:hypothetical protein